MFGDKEILILEECRVICMYEVAPFMDITRFIDAK